MNEQGAAAKHLRDTLVNDAAVGALIGDRIYFDVAPKDATYPFVLYSLRAGRDRLVPGNGARMLVRSQWLIVAVHNQRDPAIVRRIAGLVDAALVGSTATITLDGQGYYVQTVYRSEPFERSGKQDGTTYVNSGGVYATSVYSVP